MVMTASASVTVSPADLPTLAPCARSASAFDGVRFHTVTSCPARSRCPAIWLPILPNPRNAIFIADLFHVDGQVDMQVAQMQRTSHWLRRKVMAGNGDAALLCPCPRRIRGMMHQFHACETSQIIGSRGTAKVWPVAPRRS